MHRLLLSVLASSVTAGAAPQRPAVRPSAPPYRALARAASDTSEKEPERPALAPGADVNDWGLYYDLGVQLLGSDRRRADAAFYWAARLDPTRAEPPYARWVAYWLRNVSRFEAYMDGDEKLLRSPDVVRAERLRALAFRRNPFVHQGLFLVIIDALPGTFGNDVQTQAWIAYANGDLPKAVSRFAVALRHEPKNGSHLRYIRAAAFVGMGAYDSASVELGRYVASLRARDEKGVKGVYESKAMLEYAHALLYEQLRQPQATDEALGRALREDMSYAPAHAKIGRRALSAGQLDEAVAALTLALDIDPTDVVARLALGDALMYRERFGDAVAEYRRAVAAEPYYVEGVYRLAVGLERSGALDEAATAYARALTLGARTWPNAQNARARIEALKARR
jgi:tetratricopeptide (TPR) repeat protein